MFYDNNTRLWFLYLLKKAGRSRECINIEVLVVVMLLIINILILVVKMDLQECTTIHVLLETETGALPLKVLDIKK